MDVHTWRCTHTHGCTYVCLHTQIHRTWILTEELVDAFAGSDTEGQLKDAQKGAEHTCRGAHPWLHAHTRISKQMEIPGCAHTQMHTRIMHTEMGACSDAGTHGCLHTHSRCCTPMLAHLQVCTRMCWDTRTAAHMARIHCPAPPGDTEQMPPAHKAQVGAGIASPSPLHPGKAGRMGCQVFHLPVKYLLHISAVTTC